MNKNWLIRTKNNHILGPVSKEKIQQLVSNGSIKGDDEICSGNGYWLYIREQELISKYVFGESLQSFNPVQEAMPILAPRSSVEKRSIGSQSSGSKDLPHLLPSESDLMYPDAENFVESQTDDTAIGIGQAESGKQAQKVETPSPPNAPKAKRTPATPKAKKVEEALAQKQNVSAPKKKNIEVNDQIEEKIIDKKVKNSLSSRKLILFTVVFVIICATLLYFRNPLVKKLIETSSIIMPEAVAQTLPTNKKKNGLIPLLSKLNSFRAL